MNLRRQGLHRQRSKNGAYNSVLKPFSSLLAPSNDIEKERGKEIKLTFKIIKGSERRYKELLFMDLFLSL